MLGLSALLVMTALSAACRAQPAQSVQSVQPAPAAGPPFRATSTIRELMQSMIAPSAQGLWDSVGRVSDAKGTRDIEPRSDEEWAAVRRHAVSLMESTNLLLIRGRHVAREGEQSSRPTRPCLDRSCPRQRLRSASIRRGTSGQPWSTIFTAPRRPCSMPLTRRTSPEWKAAAAISTECASPAM